jgi:poly(A) polymerase
MQQGGWHSHDVFGHALLTASLTPRDLVTRLAGLLHDVGKPARHELKDGKPTFIGHQEVGAEMAAPALRRLRYPGEVIDDVTKLIRLHMRPIQYDPEGWEDKAVRRLVRDAGDQLDRLLALARADMRASHYPDVKKIDDLEARIRRLDAQAIAAIRSPLTGDDLMARTGRPSGPWIKRVKAALEDAIIDGALEPDPEAAWRYLESHPELLKD